MKDARQTMLQGLRRLAGNTTSLFASDVVNRVATFALYALVGRYLGAFAFGQLSLAFEIYYMFQVFALLGLRTLITREIAKDKLETGKYIVNACVAIAISSMLSIAAQLVFVWLMGYTRDTAFVILLLSVGMLPYSLSAICEAVFQAWEKMHFIAYINIPMSIIRLGLVFLILSQGYGLYDLIIMLLSVQLVILGFEWLIMLRHFVKPRFRIDFGFCLSMIRSTSTFMGIDAIIALTASIDILLLSRLTNEIEVGLYSAVVKSMMPLMLFAQSVVLGFFPIMCRKFKSDFHNLKHLSEQVLEFLLVVSMPIVVGLFFLADSALLLLYGSTDFVSATVALRIMIWQVLLSIHTAVFGRMLLASLRERVTLRIVAIDGLVTLVIGVVLISRFGIVGAAVTSLVTRIVDAILHYVSISRVFSRLALGRVIWKPFVASALMGLFLAMGRPSSVLLTIIVAGAIYTGALLGLATWSAGGIRQLKAEYVYLWSE